MYRIFTALVLGLVLVSCGGKNDTTDASKPTISVSVAPQAWFAEQIAGDLVSVHTMVPRGANPETYDPAPLDIARLEESALFIYTGTLPFEISWIDHLSGSGTRTLNLSEQMPHSLLFPEEDSEVEMHAHPLGDPHFWTSFEGGRKIAETTYRALLALLPSDSARLTNNYEALDKKISTLREEARQALKETQVPKAFVIYHPSLTAFSRELGLRQIVIENNGKEPSPGDLAKVLEEASKSGAKVMMIQQEFNPANSRSIAQELSLKEVEINPYDYDWEAEMRHLISALSE